MTIHNRQLRAAFLTPAMAHYFARKLPDIPTAERVARIEETLKFLLLTPQCTGSIPVSREIDEVWHFWILQTEQYDALCAALPTREFIHHSSNDYLAFFGGPKPQHDEVLSNVRMLAAYVANFGPFAQDRVKYWRLAAELRGKHGWSMRDLNAWLGQASRSRPGTVARPRSKRQRGAR